MNPLKRKGESMVRDSFIINELKLNFDYVEIQLNFKIYPHPIIANQMIKSFKIQQFDSKYGKITCNGPNKLKN